MNQAASPTPPPDPSAEELARFAAKLDAIDAELHAFHQARAQDPALKLWQRCESLTWLEDQGLASILEVRTPER